MKFRLEIGIGNDAMLTAGDAAEALRRVAALLEMSAEEALEPLAVEYPGGVLIRDLNGNRVGRWWVE